MRHTCRHHDSETDTDATDAESTCGGIGKFEYSAKALPHALLHTKELVIRGGHHGAFCTFVAEAAHPHYIKKAAEHSRTYSSHNQSHGGMLRWVLEQRVWNEVTSIVQRVPIPVTSSTPPPDNVPMEKKLANSLPYTDNWSVIDFPHGSIPYAWGNHFISKKVRLTRWELISCICNKLGMVNDHIRVLKNLHFQCFGSLVTPHPSCGKRKFAGIDSLSPKRRDFV